MAGKIRIKFSGRIRPDQNPAYWQALFRDGIPEIGSCQFFFDPDERLPSEACDVATFVRLGQTGLGIGSKLFEATKRAARELGYSWINATIRADNESGLTYYQSRGFEDYARKTDVPLGNGFSVDRISKRYDL